LVTVQGAKSKENTIPLPFVFISPLRIDIVRFVHTNMRKNQRQPHSVSKWAGMQHSAESWGTGRAVSRIPRVSGGGTHRAGQGAFGNMCRKGRMFAPTKLYRRWHRRINLHQKRYAVCSALAATSVPALVMARGHRIDNIPEIPLVLADAVFEGVSKTKQAMKIIETYKIDDEINCVKNSRKIRAGKGKARNRRHVAKRGPLIIHNGKVNNLVLAFRNIPGIKLSSVYHLNLLELAPGGHLGRFIIWTESAFRALNYVFGTYKQNSKQKSGFRPPQSILYNPDISRIITSEEVKAVTRPRRKRMNRHERKKNPLKNFAVMVKLNPYAATTKRRTIIAARGISERRRREYLKKKSGVVKPKVDKSKFKPRTPEKTKKIEELRKKRIQKRRNIKAATATWRNILLTPAIAPKKSAEERLQETF